MSAAGKLLRRFFQPQINQFHKLTSTVYLSKLDDSLNYSMQKAEFLINLIAYTLKN